MDQGNASSQNNLNLIEGKLYIDNLRSYGMRPLLRKEENGQVGSYYTITEIHNIINDHIILLFLGKEKAVDKLSLSLQTDIFYKFLWGDKLVYLEEKEIFVLLNQPTPRKSNT